jgi:hypothetical protein
MDEGFHWSDSTTAGCVSLQFCVFPILNRFKARSPVDTSGEAWGTPLMWGYPNSWRPKRTSLALRTSPPWPQGKWWVDFEGIPKGNHGSYPPNLRVSTRFSHQSWNIPKKNLKCSSFHCVKRTWRICANETWRNVVKSVKREHMNLARRMNNCKTTNVEAWWAGFKRWKKKQVKTKIPASRVPLFFGADEKPTHH